MSSLKRPQCAVCKARHDLQKCGGCKVVHYCGRDDQSADRANHKTLCNAIKLTREALGREEVELRRDAAGDPFRTAAGRFWDHAGTHAYMRARLAAAEALLGADTKLAGETALRHLQSLLRLDRRDELGVRDVLPGLMLRLGLEQECYDFLKWWATVDPGYDFGDVSLPFLNVRKANVLEPVETLSLDRLSLSQLSLLTLLKVRLGLDFEIAETELLDPDPYRRSRSRYHDSSDSDSNSDSDSDSDWGPFRRVGKLAAKKLQLQGGYDDLNQAADLNLTAKDQRHTLWQAVHHRNLHFWETLADEEAPSRPQGQQASYGRGTIEEAELAVCRVKAAWDDSEDAMVVMSAETAELAPVYRGPYALAENRRGTGKHFPTKFEPVPTSTPADLFPAGTRRFVSREGKKVLVYTDGACPDNGRDQARGGWAVVFGPPPHVASGRLERTGPFGDTFPATSNRAELRAVIAALRVRDWRAEGFAGVVVATDSSYVVDGATAWARKWTRNAWKTADGQDVKNRDLWELLLGDFDKCHKAGLGVQLWNIPRGLNGDADAAAKKAAAWDVPGLVRSPLPAPNAGPRVLAICIESDLFDRVWKTYVSTLDSKANVERATTPSAALAVLDELAPPSIILVADGTLSRHRRLWERVMDRLVGAGATVVVAGLFSSLVSTGEFDRFFAKLDLPWRMGEYNRLTVKRQPGAVVGVGDGRLAAQLPVSYSQKAVFVKGADRASVWYAPEDNPDMAAALLTEVGNGRIGYVGDVNGEVASATVAVAMCGLLEY